MENINVNRCTKFYTIILILAPILNQYKIPGLNFVELIAIYGLTLVLVKRPKIYNDRFLVYMCTGLITTIISTFILLLRIINFDLNIISYILRIIKYISVVFGIGIACEFYFDLNFAKKIYTILIGIISLLLIFQIGIHFITGKNLFFIIPGVTLNYNNSMNSSELLATNINKISHGYYFRPSSLFLEPAYYALYVLPWICFYLYQEKINFKKILFSLMVSVTCVLTTSSLGILGCVIIWLCYFIIYIKKNKFNHNTLLLFFIMIFICILCFFLLLKSDDILTSINIKLGSLRTLDNASSTSMRLLRGWFFYDQLDFLSKLIGVGYGNLSMFYHSTGMNLIYDLNLTEVSYMCGFATIINSFGIIGLFLFINWLLTLYKNSTLSNKILIVILCVILFTSDCYDSAFYWLIYAMIVSDNNI